MQFPLLLQEDVPSIADPHQATPSPAHVRSLRILPPQPKLRQARPGIDTHDAQPRRDRHAPRLELQHLARIRRVGSRNDRPQQEQVDDIPGHPMVLPDLLRPLLPAVHRRERPHAQADGVLQDQHGHAGEAQVGVGGVEVRVGVGGAVLVDEDDGGAGGEAEEGEEVEAGVGDLAAAFGGGRPGGLEDLDGEGQGQDAEGVEQWVRGDEGEEGVQEDGEPDAQGEEDGADEGDPAGSEPEIADDAGFFILRDVAGSAKERLVSRGSSG